jgi:predicted RNA binding protein YcfA (HicA-like mRNA interferase family)
MMATVKVREALRRLVADGWVQTRQRGGHRQFSHPSKPGVVTISGKPSDTLAEGTWLNIQRQAGWRK